LEIAGGLEYLHKLNVIHGNLKIVRPLLHPHIGHALTFVQRNILVDVGGHARVAGLGVASLPSATPKVDVDRFFHGAALELVHPQRFGLTNTGATKESDMCAFGVLAWEVSLTLECLSGQLPNCARPFLDFRWASSVLWRGWGCGGLLNVGRPPAALS